MIEIVIRFRCQCGQALEQIVGAGAAPQPGEFGVNITVAKLPTGWQYDEERQPRCPEHPPQLVRPVTAADAAVLRIARAKLN